MSVRSPAANRAAFFLALALIAACAQASRPSAGTASVYENHRRQRIVLTPNAITIGGVAHPLTDCSDADFFCATSDIGFRISFPRRCPDFVWDAEGGPMQLLSMWPHGGAGRYATRGGSPFVYIWQNGYGLTALVYDPSTDFAAHPAEDRIGRPDLYEHKSGPRPFGCR
jgi:hypothetical protein